MGKVDVQILPSLGGWEWRVIDARGRLRLAGTHQSREAAEETGRFWLAQVMAQAEDGV